MSIASASHKTSATPTYQKKLVELTDAESKRRRRLGWCLAALATLAIATPMILLDYFWPLAWFWRVAGLAMMVVAAITVAREAWRRTRYDSGDAAADVEAAFPAYGQRLRTALDYTDHAETTAPASSEMVESLKTETSQRAQNDNFFEASSPRPLRLAASALTVAAAAALVFLSVWPELRIAAGRALLLPLEYTTVEVTPVEGPIARGENAVVKAEVVGRPLQEAFVLFRPVNSDQPWKKLVLSPTEEDSTGAIVGKLEARLENCEQDLEVKVIAGPIPHPPWRLTVLQPLSLETFSAEVTPPTYLHRDAEITSDELFQVYEGSNVRVRFELNRSPDQAKLLSEFIASNGPAPPVSLTVKGNVVEGAFHDVRRSLQFTLAARTSDGMALETSRYRLRVKQDKKPTIRFTSPQEDLEVIPTTEVVLAVEATDDQGLTKLGVAAKVGDGPLTTLWEQSLESLDTSSQGRPVLYLEDFDLTYRDAVTYYAFAEDNYFDKPRRVTTELRFIDIRPFKREFQIVKQSPGGT